MSCYNNPCGKKCGTCGASCCEHKNDCCCDLHLDWVPHTNCAISIAHDKCSDTLDLCPGIKKCQSVTHMNWNNQTGCIEYQNEKYVYSDGTEDTLEAICVSDFLPFINLNDLNDVEYDDDLAGNCYELIYKKDISCGDGCKSKTDHWENWNINSPGALVDSMDYIRGATEDGCPVYLDKPENCSFLMFSPSCVAPTGEWQAWKIPQADDCIMEPDDDGYYRVLKLDDCGCPTECRLSVVPLDGAVIDYHRDSVPDDPDFPWYYGIYNDHINLHLADNAPQYFGKYDLEVTINYGIQVIHSQYCHNVNFRSIVVPVIQGEDPDVQREGSILQDDSTSAIETVDGTKTQYYIPWGSKSMRSSFTFIVPKGKEAWLYHEFRLRANGSFPNYHTNPTYDGKRVPDEIASQVNRIPWNASRLNALQVLVRPTRSAPNFNPVKDEYRQQLDPAVDLYPPY